MAARHAIAALLAVVVVAAVVSADGDLPSRWKLRRWVRECRKDSAIAKSKPLYAFKKSIAGLYDPKTRHAFRKTKVSFAKFEVAKIRNPSEAEKCLLECLAEKQGLINGSQLQPTKIMNVMTAFGKRINEMHSHTHVNMTKLKRNTAKCIVGTHGSAKTCELGFHLYHCLRSAIMESIYYEEVTTAEPFSTPAYMPERTTPAYMPEPTSRAPSAQEVRPDPAPPTERPDRFMSRPSPPPPGMIPPPMPIMAAAAPPSGLAPSSIFYKEITTAEPFSTPAYMPERTTPAYMPEPTSRAPSAQEVRPDPAPPTERPDRFMSRPSPPPPGMIPPPMPIMAAAAPPSGLAPSYIAYRQGSGMVQVFGDNPTPWRPRWRGPMHHGPRMMGPMI